MLQTACVELWDRAVPPDFDGVLQAIPNGGGRSKAEAGRLKAAGLRKGALDLQMLLPGPTTVILETKLEANKTYAIRRTGLTGGQPAMVDRLTRMGFQVRIIRSPEEFQAVMDEFGVPRRGGITGGTGAARSPARPGPTAAGSI